MTGSFANVIPAGSFAESTTVTVGAGDSEGAGECGSAGAGQPLGVGCFTRGSWIRVPILIGASLSGLGSNPAGFAINSEK